MINTAERAAVAVVQQRLKQLLAAIDELEDVAMERVNIPVISETNKMVNSAIVRHLGRGTERHTRRCDIRRRLPGLDLQMAMFDVSQVCIPEHSNNEAQIAFKFKKYDDTEMFQTWGVGRAVNVNNRPFSEYVSTRAAHRPAIGIGGQIPDGIELLTVGIWKSQPYRIIGPSKGVALDGSGEIVNISGEWSRTHPIYINCHVMNRLAAGTYNVADAYLFASRIWPLVRPRAKLEYNDRTALHNAIGISNLINHTLFNAVFAAMIKQCEGVSNVKYNESLTTFNHSGYQFNASGIDFQKSGGDIDLCECTNPDGYDETMAFIKQYLKGSVKNV